MPQTEPRAKILHSLTAQEVSLVPKGANRRSFIIRKNADDGGSMTKEEKEAKEAKRKERTEKETKRKALRKELRKACPMDGTAVDKARAMISRSKELRKDASESPMTDEASAALEAVSRILAPFVTELDPATLQEILTGSGFDLGDDSDDEDGDAPDGDAPDAAAADAADAEPELKGFSAVPETAADGAEDVGGIPAKHLSEAAKAGASAFGDHLKKLGYDMYPAAKMVAKFDKKGGKVAKSALEGLDIATRGIVESVMKENEDIRVRIGKMEAEKSDAELASKAKGWKFLVQKSDDVIVLLRSAKAQGEDSYARICKSFDGLNEQGKLFGGTVYGETGTTASGGTGGDGDAWGRIEAGARDMIQKSSTPITKDKAMSLFLATDEGRRLHTEYKSGRINEGGA